MRKTLALLGVLTAAVTSFATPASAAPSPSGVLCGVATSDALNPGTQTGTLAGGPLVLGDDSNPALVYSGSVTCSVQVNQSTHGGFDVCSHTGPTTGVVAVADPTLCVYPAMPTDNVYVCTRVDVIGFAPLYYDDWSGSWTTSNSAHCALAIVATGGTSTVKSLVDPVLCPWLAAFFPPQGDVGVFYDCPPYGSSATSRDVMVVWLVGAEV